MAIVPFKELMAGADAGGYAVGYFESWNMESLLAVADAAETVSSPVMLGFSGIQLSAPDVGGKNRLSQHAAAGLEVCRTLETPCCLVFNECPCFERVSEAIRLGFGLVMFSNPALGLKENMELVRETVEIAHATSVAVEGELVPLPGMGGDLFQPPEDIILDDPAVALDFVDYTGIDAFAVNVGQVHLHGRSEVPLDLNRLAALRSTIQLPLVLHGASSVNRQDLVHGIRLGVRKINVGSVLRRSYFEGIRSACAQVNNEYNPYEVIGSGHGNDVLMAGRVALQRVVEELMCLFGSSGKA